MEKISKEEFDKLLHNGRGNGTPLRGALLQLQPGEAVIVKKKEWKVKYTPFLVADRIERSHSIKFKKVSLADRSGWAIQRE